MRTFMPHPPCSIQARLLFRLLSSPLTALVAKLEDLLVRLRVCLHCCLGCLPLGQLGWGDNETGKGAHTLGLQDLQLQPSWSPPPQGSLSWEGQNGGPSAASPLPPLLPPLLDGRTSPQLTSFARYVGGIVLPKD